MRDAMTGNPLESARVKVYGTDNEYMTGLDGSCILTGLPYQKITLEAAVETISNIIVSEEGTSTVREKDPSTPYTANEIKLPDEDESGYARFRAEVEYNCYGRDFDRVVMVLYYKDGLGNWHIVDSSDNGAYTDGSLKRGKVENVATGNSFYNDDALVLTASCTFPRVEPGNPETEVTDVKIIMDKLKPGQESVPEEPDAHFEMP